MSPPPTRADRGVVGRAFEALAALINARGDRMGVRELAAVLRLPPSSAHRLLGLLAAERMVVRNADATYSIGLDFLRLAGKATAKLSIREAARPALEALAAEVDETALLSLYDRGRREVMFVMSIDSTHPLRYIMPLNEWRPALSGASGLAICAWVPAEIAQAIFDNSARPRRELEGWRAELAAFRETGYSYSRGHLVEGAVGVAAPIFGPDGVVAAASLSMPQQRCPADRAAQLGVRVRAAADEITGRLGGVTPAPLPVQ